MDLEAFKALKAESETETFFDQLMRIHREIDRIECLYSGYPVNAEATSQQGIQAWFDGLNEDQKADPLQAARGYLSNLNEYRLEPLKENSAILENILNEMNVTIKAKQWLRPAMSSLLNKSTQDLQTIQGAISSLEAGRFDTFLNNFHEMASRIAGQNRNRLTDTYEILMDKLAEHDGKADITVRLNAAYDEVAQKCQNLNPLQRSLSVLKGFLLREPSLQNLPQTLVNPFASEAHAAVSDASAAPTPETPSEGVSVPVAGSKAPPSRLRGLLQRILKTLGSAGAFVRKHPFHTTVVGAGVVALMAAAKNLGSAPVPKPPAAVPTTPPTPAPQSGTAGEALLTKFDEAIKWRSNTGNFGDIPGQGGDHPLRALLNLQGKQGLASPNAQISGGTRDELIKLAGAANVDSDKILTAYQTGYNNAYINAYASSANITFEGNVTESVHAHAMTESLKAVKAVIAQEQEHKTSFLGRVEEIAGNILPKGAPVSAAEGPPTMPSSTPNPLATMMQGAFSRLEGVAHNVAIVAQHPAAQAAMKTLGVVGVAASVAKTVHEARSGNTALAVMNGATAVATTAAMAGLPPLAAAMGAARIGAYAADRSQTGTLDRVLAQREELTTKLATLNAEPKTVGNTVQTVTTHVALATKKADVLASQQLNALRENVQSGVKATSQMLTQAQEVTGNAVASTKENLGKLQQRVAAFFTHRQTTAAL